MWDNVFIKRITFLSQFLLVDILSSAIRRTDLCQAFINKDRQTRKDLNAKFWTTHGTKLYFSFKSLTSISRDISDFSLSFLSLSLYRDLPFSLPRTLSLPIFVLLRLADHPRLLPRPFHSRRLNVVLPRTMNQFCYPFSLLSIFSPLSPSPFVVTSNFMLRIPNFVTLSLN